MRYLEFKFNLASQVKKHMETEPEDLYFFYRFHGIRSWVTPGASNLNLRYMILEKISKFLPKLNFFVQILGWYFYLILFL